jgi:hypothetical protein
MKLITNRFPARCKQCKALVAEGAQVWWERGFGVICDPCFATPADPKTGAAYEQADADTWGVQAGIDASLSPAGDEIVALGPDALAAEIDACCAVLSDRWDGTPDEIFYRRLQDVRRYDAYAALLDTLVAEQKGRERLYAAALQEATLG